MSERKEVPAIQEKIAARVVGTMAPLLIIVLAFLSMLWVVIPEMPIRMLPVACSVGVLVVVWWVVHLGKVRLAAHLFTALMCATIIAGMALNGGVRTLAYLSSLVIVAVSAWLYGPRASVLFALAFTLVGGAFVRLDTLGVISEPPLLPPWAIWFSVSCLYVVILGATAMPNRMLHQALAESEERRVAAEEAYLREQETLRALKLGEEALRQGEKQYRDLIENIPVGLFRSTPGAGGRFLMANPAIARMFGYESVEEFMEDSVRNFAHDAVGRRVFLDSPPDVDKVRHEDIQLKKRDGTSMWGSVTAQAIRDNAGAVVFIDGFIEDITDRLHAEYERDKLQAQLTQVQKMESVGRLAGGVAHDFNNMLNVILGNAELALHEVDPALPLYEELAEIQEAAQRSAELTRQLLAFARKQTVSPRILDFNAAIAGTVKMLRRIIGEDIELVWAPNSELWRIKMDPSQLDQILTNLCVNARDAIKGTGAITIETQNAEFEDAYGAGPLEILPGQYVMLAVSDDGCGLEKETLEHIFEPFFTTKKAGQGTGLGLAMVYGAVKQNDGHLSVYSEPGRGTTFKLYLPRAMGEAEQAPPVGDEHLLSRGETVLLVEDEISLLKLSQVLLTRLGYTVLAAGSPEEAIRQAEEYKGDIHLLISDIVMPRMNGRELAARLRTIKPAMRRLFMSGYTAEVIAHRGVLEEGVHFIQKPFSRQALAAKAREALDH